MSINPHCLRSTNRSGEILLITELLPIIGRSATKLHFETSAPFLPSFLLAQPCLIQMEQAGPAGAGFFFFLQVKCCPKQCFIFIFGEVFSKGITAATFDIKYHSVIPVKTCHQ